MPPSPRERTLEWAEEKHHKLWIGVEQEVAAGVEVEDSKQSPAGTSDQGRGHGR